MSPRCSPAVLVLVVAAVVAAPAVTSTPASAGPAEPSSATDAPTTEPTVDATHPTASDGVQAVLDPENDTNSSDAVVEREAGPPGVQLPFGLATEGGGLLSGIVDVIAQEEEDEDDDEDENDDREPEEDGDDRDRDDRDRDDRDDDDGWWEDDDEEAEEDGHDEDEDRWWEGDDDDRRHNGERGNGDRGERGNGDRGERGNGDGGPPSDRGNEDRSERGNEDRGDGRGSDDTDSDGRSGGDASGTGDGTGSDETPPGNSSAPPENSSTPPENSSAPPQNDSASPENSSAPAADGGDGSGGTSERSDGDDATGEQDGGGGDDATGEQDGGDDGGSAAVFPDPEPRIGQANVTFVSVPEVVGEPLVIEATTTNRGTGVGQKVVQLEVEHEIVDRRTFLLAPGQSHTVRFTHRFRTPGNKTIEVDSGKNRFVTVRARRANFTVTDLRVSEATLDAGGEVRFTAVVANVGEIGGSRPVALELFGEVVAVKNVSVADGGTAIVSFTREIQSPGTYTASVGNESVSVTVLDSGNATTATPAGETSPGVPGFGPAVAVFALALVAVAALRRR